MPALRREATAAAAFCFAVAFATPAASFERPDAEPFLGMPETSSLGSPTQWTVEQAFPNLSFAYPVFLAEEPESNRIWVAEQAGRIVSFDNDEAASSTEVVLDIRSRTAGQGDSGLLSFAFHPSYADESSPSEGFLFVGYEYRQTTDSPLYTRVSRFTVDRATGTADPASELVLIHQLDQQHYHQGGALLFRPSDGYLYVTFGDEGGANCGYKNCQRVDRDLFSGVLRIDVDNVAATSHAPPKQPATGTTAHYSIPDDNPFVGRDDTLEEFYAIGLRSPHRMTLDPVEDRIWIGDVGQSQREEIDVLSPGANYQWNVREGSLALVGDGSPPQPQIGEWTAPLLDYGRSLGGTIIGGHVYRGSRLPELSGRYIYGDFLSGRIWALRYADAGGKVQAVENEELLRSALRGRDSGITSFGVDADGELYILTFGETAKIWRLAVAEKPPGEMPATLSATGLFTDLETLTPVPALVPYDVRVPLWSDGAGKRRWLSVPGGQQVGYSPDRAWIFPAGSVFVKHFEMQLDDGDPSSLRRLETRVLVVQDSGLPYGVTYRWRDDQSDADLLTGPASIDLLRQDADGEERVQRYDFPAPLDCIACHTAGGGSVLGVRARQFAGIAPAAGGAEAGEAEDQLAVFADAGYFDVSAGALERGSIPAFASLAESGAPLETRVRSYLDANCAHCHGSVAIDRARWDGRIGTPLAHQGIVGGSVLGVYGSEDDRVVVPGDPLHSVMRSRVVATDPGLRMPPLARNVPDEAFVAALDAWIADLAANPVPPPVCGDSTAPWDVVSAADALGVLRAAVGLDVCEPCICDANGNGSISSADALLALRRAVGLVAALDCVPCFELDLSAASR